jgi:hypothetical protein
MKKLGFDILKGATILSTGSWSKGDQEWLLVTSAGTYRLFIEDNGVGGNDSHAYLDSVNGLVNIIGQPIVEVTEESDSYGAVVTLTAANDANCTIVIVHDHNGYYGFSYELVALPSKS